MKWKQPPVSKIYEALGTIADTQRIELEGNSAKVFSSSRNKYYEVQYDKAKNAITSNDNGSFWVGYLGYPAIAYLLAAGIITYDARVAKWLKGIPWKNLNTKNKNDFDKTVQFVRQQIEKTRNADLTVLDQELTSITKQLKDLDLNKLSTTQRPPSGY